MKVNKLVEVRLNTHQQHLESLPVFGQSGLDELNNYIEKLLKQLTTGTKELTLMSKIDGAPSVIMWHKIGNGYPDNSIALKSFVNGPSTAMSSAEEIDKKYSDRPDMAEKLKQCLKLAKYIPTGEAWQGDCLFTKNDLKEETINGVTYVTFHPNKIVYAFSEDNPGYNSIKNADFGIAFHTIYTINNGVISQSFEVDNSRINAPDNFYLLFHEMGTQNKENDFNVDKLIKDFSELKQIENKLINDPNYEDLVNNNQFISYWNTFENREFADNKKTNINPNTILKDLKDYILNKKEQEFNKKQSTLKTDQGRAKAKEKYDSELLELEDLLNNNKDTIINMVNAINKAADVKMDLWRSLNKTKDEYSSFYKSKSKGFIPANREGISMSDADGNLVKIVDRSEFSSNNRNPDYMAGFEHESFSVATQGADMGSFNKFNKNIDETLRVIDKIDNSDIIYSTYNFKDVLNILNQDKSWKLIYDPVEEVFIIGDPFYVTHNEMWRKALDKGLIKSIDQLNYIYLKKNSDHDPDEYSEEEFSGSSYPSKLDGRLFVYGSGADIYKTPFKDIIEERLSPSKKNDNSKIAVVAVGRMNPPTIGHKALVNALAKIGSKYGVKPKLFLTHSTNNIKNPLSYESKLRWAAKAFGDDVEIVRSNARSIIEFLSELYNEGYTKIVYAGDKERIGGTEDVSNNILRYNGKPDKSGKLLYNFDEIVFENTGSREVPYEGAQNASATHVRKLAADKNFDEFKKYVPFNENDAKNLFNELRFALKDFTNIVEKYLKEVKKDTVTKDLTKKEYTPEIQRKLDVELDKIDKSLDAPNANMGANEYIQNKSDYTGLYVKQKSDQSVVYNVLDIPKLNSDNGEEILKDLQDLRVKDGSVEYKINPTGRPSVLSGNVKFDDGETTYYQEAIYSLALLNRIPLKNKSLSEFLEDSDPEKSTGIFKLINLYNYNKATFKDAWTTFIRDWADALEIAVKQHDVFISKASKIMPNVESGIILHPGVKSKYDGISRTLLSGADTFDKSDFYVCTGNVGDLSSSMIDLRTDPVKYSKFMQKNRKQILGVSLKKPSGSLHVVWDIPAKNNNYFTTVALKPTEAKSQMLVFDTDDGHTINLNIRTNSAKGAISMEWNEKGGSAQLGKASNAFAYYTQGTKLNSLVNAAKKSGDTRLMATILLKYLTGNNRAKPGVKYELSEEGSTLITNMFNLSAGFAATNNNGERITAPYIKVY